MVAALTIGSTGTRPADELTEIGGRKHARFEAGTVRRGPAGATGRSWSGALPTSAPPARPCRALGGGEKGRPRGPPPRSADRSVSEALLLGRGLSSSTLGTLAHSLLTRPSDTNRNSAGQLPVGERRRPK